jgi:hypothetical protein
MLMSILFPPPRVYPGVSIPFDKVQFTQADGYVDVSAFNSLYSTHQTDENIILWACSIAAAARFFQMMVMRKSPRLSEV